MSFNGAPLFPANPFTPSGLVEVQELGSRTDELGWQCLQVLRLRRGERERLI